jgi:hypothetical protein
MLMLAYIKQNGEWKLDSFNYANYQFHGLTAPDMFKKAKALEEQGELLPALLYTIQYDRLLRPAPNVQYKIEKDMLSFENDIQSEIKDAVFFPDNIDGSQYYGVDIISTQQGLTPEIKYVTSLNKDDIEKIEQEAKKIHEEMVKSNPGYEKEFDYFLYQAFFEPPADSDKTYEYYRTMIE